MSRQNEPQPGALPPPLDDALPQGWQWVETHISRVLLGPSEVFKIKKPVDLGFLDFTTLEARKAACLAEVRLNRRLAPAVYLGVLPVTRDRDRGLRIGGEGPVVDWAVHMQRVPDVWRADVRVEEGRLGTRELEAIARRLARFHAECDPAPVSAGLDAVRANVTENFKQTRGFAGDMLPEEQLQELKAWHRRVLIDHEDRFRTRAADGFVRDGHGDLKLEHVYLDDANRVTVLDCIEFNDRFRFGDTCADVAFLYMDLAFRDRVDLAERFLALYAREANDYGLYGLIDFYESYRAHVRAKIAAIMASDLALGRETRERAAGEAARYLRLAVAAKRPPLVPPMLVVVGGPIASGKSTVAAAIADRLSAPVVDSDRTRKHLAGMEAQDSLDDPAWSGRYSPSATAAVYEEVMRRGGVVLQSGRAVVVDATFRSREQRALVAALAETHGVPFRFVECCVPEEVERVRLARRDREGSVSDGRLEILSDFLKRWEPVSEFPPAVHIRLDTVLALTENLDRLDFLPGRPGDTSS